MAKFWALQVIMGRVTLDKVPAKYRDAVVKILQDMDTEYNQNRGAR